ncbi:MAG: hypothetical protein FJ189_03210 [Gammaproteobacteria bacterium]|nr:hypothetical protein [Gammaproteobacteria bacterium]
MTHNDCLLPARPQPSDRVAMDGCDQWQRPDWVAAEQALRAEADTYRRQLHVLREAREQLDSIWSAHPDWTFEQVCARYLAEHPDRRGEDSA